MDIDHLMGDDFLGELHGMQRNVRGTALKKFLSHPVFEQAYLKSERLQFCRMLHRSWNLQHRPGQ